MLTSDRFLNHQPGFCSVNSVLDPRLVTAIKVPGHMIVDELAWILQQSQLLASNATWVELGVFCGRSLMAAGLGLPKNATLAAVDWRLGLDSLQGHGYFNTYLSLCETRPDLQILGIRMRSNLAARFFSDRSVDVVFVDADHGYESVLHDIQAWLPKIKLGGMMCGHDFHEVHWPGVVQAVRESMPEAKTINVGTLWAMRISGSY